MKEALNCTASIVADSIVDAISFITGILFCDQKTSFSQIRLWLRLRPDLTKSDSVQHEHFILQQFAYDRQEASI